MTAKSVFQILFLVALFANSPAHAGSHVLTIRQLASTEYEAVITYDSKSFCNPTVNPPSSIQVIGFEVHIESPQLDSSPCIEPTPPIIIFEETTNIGTLTPGNYTVSWIQPNLFALSKALFVSATSQEGPLVPCVGCDTLTQVPFPETGSWYNPDQSGSGVSMEMQGGVLVGFYFGYDLNGNAMWYLFSGLLVRSTQAGVQWELVTHLQHYQGGNCLGCVYQPPQPPTEGPAIRLEFLQRNYMRLTIDSNPGQFFVPIIFGSGGHSYFSAQTPYVFPEYGAHFVFIFKPNTDPPEQWKWRSAIYLVDEGKEVAVPVTTPVPGEPQGIVFSYIIWPPGPPISRDVVRGDIVCRLEPVPGELNGQPGCTITINAPDDFPNEYIMPIGQMSDSRFFGEAADGSTVEAYRLSYD